MSKVFLCDLDGTIANCAHRLQHINGPKKDWAAFFAACSEDEPIVDVIALLQILYAADNRIVYMSGRSDEVRKLTEAWLVWHNLPPGGLYMREQGDHRPDYIVKSELLDEVLKVVPREQIAGIFDDRQQVVDMYRRRGFRVYQVAPGDF